MTKRRWIASLGAGSVLALLAGWGLSALELVTEPEPPRVVHVYVWTESGAAHCACSEE